MPSGCSSTFSLPSSADPGRRRLVVSIHDVAPETFDGVRIIVDALNRINARPRVYKVIPEHLGDNEALITFLRAEQDDGSEILLHGYSHRRDGIWRGPWRRRLRAQLFARTAAEFLSLSEAEIESRLTSGRQILESAGLSVDGFCAPGWIASGPVRASLRRLGFGYDVALTHLVELRTGRRVWTDWVGYMGADDMQERLVGIANRINRATLPAWPVGKVFLHPQGAGSRPGYRRIIEWMPQLMRGRTLSTFRMLLA